MGCAKYIACKDCKKNYYLGYGSYSTWISPDEIKGVSINNLLKNRNLEKVLLEHWGHDIELYSPDWSTVVNGHLTIDYTGDIIVENIIEFEDIDLWREKDLDEN